MQFIAMRIGVSRSSLLSCLVLVFVAETSRSRADDVAQKPAASASSENDDRPAADFKLIRGRVVDDANAPVADARLWLPLRYQPRRVVEGATDGAGRFELKFPADWIDPRSSGSSWPRGPGPTRTAGSNFSNCPTNR